MTRRGTLAVEASDPVVLGLDLGTSSAKVSAVDGRGRGLGSASAGYPTRVPAPGQAEQDPHDWLPAVARAVRELLAAGRFAPARVAGLAITSAAHIAVLLDAAGEPLRPAILWSDQRSHAEAAGLAEGDGERIYAMGRNWPGPTWTLAQLVWLRRHEPSVWARVAHIMLSRDYLGWLLTGESATDAATGVSALLLDAGSGGWSKMLCALAGIEPALLPAVRPIGAHIGDLTAAAAQQLGLPAGLPLYNGTLDSTAETLCAGVGAPGQCVLRLASAGGLHVVSDGAACHRRGINYPYPVEPLWLTQFGTNTCATAVDWACRVLGAGADAAGAGGQGGDALDFDAWSALAASAPPGADGLLFHPYLAGERSPYWDARLRASFTGLTLQHGRAHLARAVYEGTALSLRDAMSVLEPERRPAALQLVGGGTRSELWCRIVAAVFDVPASTAPGADSAAGAARIALVGCGALPDLAAAAALPGSERVEYRPEPALVAVYRQAFEAYLEVQRRLAP